MSWQPVSYWTLRCDGAAPHGQCREVLHPEPDSMVVPLAWGRHGDVEAVPTLFSGGQQSALAEHWVREHGWFKAGDRILCPMHADELEQETGAAVDAVLENHVEAEIDGLPFEFEEGTA